MFLMWRLVKLGLKLVLALALAVAAFVAWALLWPAPHVRPERCRGHLAGCAAASGRVLYHTSFGPGRRAHVVLISSRSTSLPGIVVGEFPAQMTHAPAGLGFGDWVSISGQPKIGSHHERDIHVLKLATAKLRIQCGVYNSRHLCTKAAAWPGRQ